MPKGCVCVRLGSHFLVIASSQVEGGAKVCSLPKPGLATSEYSTAKLTFGAAP